jgi:hypothetical protein
VADLGLEEPAHRQSITGFTFQGLPNASSLATFLLFFALTATKSVRTKVLSCSLQNFQSTQTARDENGFGIFQNSRNRFRNFSIGFTGNGIFRKRNRFSKFSMGISVEFYRPFPSVTGFCRKLPDLCFGIFRNCLRIFQHVIFSHRLYVSG